MNKKYGLQTNNYQNENILDGWDDWVGGWSSAHYSDVFSCIIDDFNIFSYHLRDQDNWSLGTSWVAKIIDFRKELHSCLLTVPKNVQILLN
jgi:hypothetical protein